MSFWIVNMPWLGKWLDLSLRSKCLVLIAFPVAAITIMAGASYLAEVQGRISTQQLTTSLQIGNAIERLRTSEIETSGQLRAYLITGDEPFAIEARGSIAAFESAWRSLSNLTRNDSLQRQRLAQIEVLEREQVEHIFGNMARFEAGDLRGQQLAGSVRAAETDQIGLERILKTMGAANAAAIDAYPVRVDKLRARHVAISTFCLFAGVAGGVLMMLLFAQGITGRLHQLHQNFARVASGEDLNPLEGWDEIGTLNVVLGVIGRLLRQRRAILESALDGIAEVDAQGRYRWQNKAYAELAGLSEVHQPPTIQATVPDEERPKILDAIRTMRLSGKAEVTALLEPPAGPRSEVEMMFLDTPGQPEAGFFLFLRKSGFGKLGAHEVIQANDAAVASNRAKTDFLAKISHDIRTPLNAILGAADLLSQTSLTFDQSGYVHMFKRNCRRLVALINDFLDFSRIEAGAVRIEKTPVQIREVVDDAVSTFRDEAARKGLALRLDFQPRTPEWLIGDSFRIQQVLVNLLSNALKFTTVGGVDVRVSMEDGAGPDGRGSYEVVDTGPGIAPEDQDKDFREVHPVAQSNLGSARSGAGTIHLPDLVELMGGEIGVSSREGGGSNFHFTLPLEAVDEPEPQPALPAAASAARGSAAASLPARSEAIRVLVAEDTEDNRLLVEHYLRTEQVELRFAFTGQEAVEVVERGHKFDLILMDLDMPILDGIAATKAIRAWQAVRGISPTPIVALSADAMNDAVRSSLDAGCVAHVAKRSTAARCSRPSSAMPA